MLREATHLWEVGIHSRAGPAAALQASEETVPACLRTAMHSLLSWRARPVR